MKGSEFVQQYRSRGFAAWEAAAVSMAEQTMAGVPDLVARWPMTTLTMKSKDGKYECLLDVSSDVFAIGTADDYVRLPLTPEPAQAVANIFGCLLPTPKIVYERWRQAPSLGGYQLVPHPITNRGAVLDDYAKHSQIVDGLLAAQGGRRALVTGIKKSIIISNIYKPGKVLIYGWFWPEGTDMTKEPAKGYSQPIQGRSNVHGDFFVDYSHGIELVANACRVRPVGQANWEDRKTEDVLRDPILWSLLSDEGPLHTIRYPARNSPAPYRPKDSAEYHSYNDVYPKMNTASMADVGLDELARRKGP